MKAYGVNELRRIYLSFFESKEHLKMKSFSLVPPHTDKSLLLIGAGMAPLKPYFTGQEIPPSRRVTTCQKCMRTTDIENVGKTARHLTFFEMLGNFSFGDYFKQEAIAWSWEFLTKTIGMDPDRLYPSIYGEDEEAFEIWNKEIGIPAEKITRFYRDENGDCDNFWEHGAGPCGPARRSITIGERSMAAADPTAKWAATATALWKSGTMYSLSLRATERAIIRNFPRKILTPAWVWSVWPWWCRM